MATMARSAICRPLQYSYLKESPFVNPTAVHPELKAKISQVSLLSLRKKNARNPCTILPVIRAHSHRSPDFTPEAKFYKIEAILRPWRIPQVSSALLKIGIRGVTVSDVRGLVLRVGQQKGMPVKRRRLIPGGFVAETHVEKTAFNSFWLGSEFSEDKFVTKVKMEVVVSKEQVEEVIERIIEEARTGEIGDGKIFLVPVSDVIRVRTGQRGEEAERMTGGRSDMVSTITSN